MKRIGVVAIALGVLAAESGAFAAPGPLAGHWTFSGDNEGTAACSIVLGSKSVAAGYKMTVPSACRQVFAAAAHFAAWRPTPEGGIAFNTASGHAALVFGPVADGDFLAQLDNGNGYVLTRRPRPGH